MIIINFGHPLTAVRLQQIESSTGKQIERVIDSKNHFDESVGYYEQLLVLFDNVGLSSEEWQTLPLIVNLPPHNVIAALTLAEIHGRAGYFPTVLRLREMAGSTPREFEFAEILNLQSVRDAARQKR